MRRPAAPRRPARSARAPVDPRASSRPRRRARRRSSSPSGATRSPRTAAPSCSPGSSRSSPRSASTSGWCGPASSGSRAKAGSTRAHRPRKPLPADARRRAPVRAGVSADLRAAGRALGRLVGARASPTDRRGAAPRAARGARLGRLRRAGAGRLRPPVAGAVGRAAHRRRRSGSPHRRRRTRAVDDETLGGSRSRPQCSRAWDLAGVAADYRRFLARFGSVIQRFRRPTRRRTIRSNLHRPHAADPRLSPRAAARPATAGRACCRSIGPAPRPTRSAATSIGSRIGPPSGTGRDAAQRTRRAAARIGGVLPALRRTRRLMTIRGGTATSDGRGRPRQCAAINVR